MANESGNIVVDKKDAMKDALKNAADLSKRSTEDLKGFFDEYKKGDDYSAVAELATELASRSKTETIISSIDSKKELAEAAIKEQEDTTKFQQEITKQKTEENQNKQDKISELTAKLNESDKKIMTLKETVDKLLEAQKENRDKTSKSLDDILESKKNGDIYSVKKLKEEIVQLTQEKKDLEEKSKQKIMEYPSDEISTMKTKLIKGRLYSRKTTKTEDGVETLTKRPNVKINKHILARRKLNQVVHAFNGFKKDSDAAVKYILTQERGSRVDTLTGVDALAQSMNRGRYGLLHSSGFVMSKEKFEEKFEAQKKKIIDQFKNNINPVDGSPEDTTINALEVRMKWYKQSYMQKHY